MVRVVDLATNQGVNGVRVRIHGPTDAAGVTAGTYGQYLFAEIPPGEYTVEVSTANLPSYAAATVTPDHPRTVEVEPGDLVPVIFYLGLHCSVRVKVLRSTDSQPIPNCLIDLSGVSGGTSAVPQGKYGPPKEWQSPKFNPGKYRVLITLPTQGAEEYGPPPVREIAVKPGTNPLVVIPVDPLPCVEVTVTNDYDDLGVEEVLVALNGPDTDALETGNDGVTRSKLVRVGEGYTVQISLKPNKVAKYRDMPPITDAFPLAAGQVKKIALKITPKILELTQVDPWFAPMKEKNNFQYKIHGLWDQPVRLSVNSAQYATGPIYQIDLQDGEKTNGAGKTISWGGLSNSLGALQNRYIHPLLSPFQVKLYHSDELHSEKDFKVLYHSLKLHPGPWVPDPSQLPQKGTLNKWVRYKLNKLGYYGGPVETDVDGYMDKAVVRYKANHKSLVKLDYHDYATTADSALQDALDSGDNEVEYLTGDAITNSRETSRIYVEALTYQIDGATNEFDSAKKHEKERERLNRPLIPIEAVIFIKNKAGKGVAASEAVGPCRISWRFTDPQEVLAPQYTPSAAEPSHTQEFIRKAQEAHGGRQGATRNNCHTDFGGIRGADDDYHAAPFLLGDYYVPYQVQRDDGQRVVYSLACVDKAQYPKRVGQAGIFFRPSIIAGDQYKLTAEIDFTGLPNAVDLEGFHNVVSVAKRIHADTGTFEIWRRNAVVLAIDWPRRAQPPAVFPALDWTNVRAEYAKAFHDIKIDAIQSKPIGEVINQEEYRDAACKARTSLVRGNITFHADTVYGLDLPAQGIVEPDKYRTSISTKAKEEFWDDVSRELRKTISKNMRKSLPNGFIAVDFLSHKPVTIYDTAALPADQPTASSVTRPSVASVTANPSPPAPNAAFEFIIGGTGFAADAAVIFSKEGSEVVVGNDVLTTKTAVQLNGPATLGGGNYLVSVKNTASGERSPGIQLKVPTNLNYVSWTFSVGLPDSVIYLDQRDPDKVYFVMAHEMGHNLFLKHWENTSGPIPMDHDQADHNCLMSYSSSSSLPFQALGVYTPHFCGKCNLKLRGWDVTHAGVPKINPSTHALLEIGIVMVNPNPNIGEEFDVTITLQNHGAGNVHALELQLGGSKGDKDLVSFVAAGTTFTKTTGIWAVGDVLSGETKVLVLKMKPKPNAAGKTIIVNCAFKSATEAPILCVKAEAKAQVKDAELKLTLAPVKLDPMVAEEVEVAVTVKNDGPDAASNVKVDFTLPPGVDLIDGNLGGALAIGPKTWTIGDLAKDATSSGKIKLKPTAGAGGAVLPCSAEVKADEGGKTPADRTKAFDLTLQASANLVLSINPANVAGPSGAEAGPVVITVRNNGPDNATGVYVSFSSPDLKFRTLNASQGAATAASGQYPPYSGEWTVGALNNGAQATLTYRARPTKKGTLDLPLYLSADQMNPQSTSSVSLRVQST